MNNYVANVSITDYADQLDLRGDHSFRSSDTMFVRYSWSDREITLGSFFAPPGNGGNGFGDYPLIQLPKAWSIAGGETHIFSTSLVNELRIGFTRNKSDQLSPASQSLYDQFGIKGVPQFEGLYGLPTFTVTNFASLGYCTFAPHPKRVGVFQLSDNLSWTREITESGSQVTYVCAKTLRVHPTSRAAALLSVDSSPRVCPALAPVRQTPICCWD